MTSSTPSPVRPARALDPMMYLDPAVLDREKDMIFFRTWQYAGHVSQLPKAGDYFTFEIFDQRLFCIRGRDETIRCFYNVCQHRAHELLDGTGNRRLLVCPYHAWAYELDGRLRKAPGADRVPGFDTAGICLTPVRLEIFCGFLFVNLDATAAPMAAWYPDVDAQLRAYVPQIDRLAPIAWVDVEENCNWKVSVENYSECYHCRLNHPAFSNGIIDPQHYNVEPQGHCLRHTTTSAGGDRMTYSIDAAAGSHAADYASWFLWPGFSFQVYPGALLNTYLWRPLDVGRVMVWRGWYTVDGVETDLVTKMAETDRLTTVAEDVRLVDSVQRGLRSRGYKAGPLIIDPDHGVNSEHSIKAIHDWVRAALDIPDPAVQQAGGGPTSPGSGHRSC